MCTLAVAVGLSELYPLVVAANRDEWLLRPSAGPRLWEGKTPFVAPVDLQAQGTWMGVNARGLFVGITNRFGSEHLPERRSRGQLVAQALALDSAAQVHQALSTLEGDAYNGFHLLYADASGGCAVTWGDGRVVHQVDFGRGLHVLSERSFGAADAPRVDLVREAFPRASLERSPDVPALMALLQAHDLEDPLAAPCVHLPALGYGTRSSAILLLGARPDQDRLWWAEGPPCQAGFMDRSGLLQSLGRQAG